MLDPRCTAALAALALSGCASMTAECATHGGQPWLRVTSPSFTVSTNLGPDDAREATLGLERSLAVLRHVFPDAHRGARIEAVVFRNTMQLEDITGTSRISGLMINDWRGALVLIGSTAYVIGTTTEDSVLLHELTHHVASYAFARQSRWLAEGLAMYFETATVDAAGHVRAGGPMLGALDRVRRSPPLTLEELWQWDTDDRPLDDDPALTTMRYASSWLYVHYLYNHHERELTQWLSLLTQGTPPRAAFESAFSGIAPATIESQARGYAEDGKYSAHLFSIGDVAANVAARPLPDAEVHALLARIALSGTSRPRVQHELEAALALDAATPLGFEMSIFGEDNDARALERTTAYTTQHPSEARGFWLLSLAQVRNRRPLDERLRSLETAHRLDADDPDIALELAACLDSMGRVEEAVPLAEQAVRLAPYRVSLQVALARTLARVGRCPEAVKALEHAKELISEHATPQARARLLAPATDMVRGCAPPP